MLDKLQGRNGSGEFAGRSMKNLDFILGAAENHEEVHPVTQTIGALLGIVVFPWEKNAFNAVKKKRIAVATSEGWPKWRMSGTRINSNQVKTVGDLIKLVRNSIAHGHVTFDSDSRNPSDVMVTFENYPKGSKNADWKGSIQADALADFCRQFSNFVADYVS